MSEHDILNVRLQKLMAAAQSGGRKAYAELLGEVATLLRGWLRRRYGYLGRDDLEDILQEILLAIHSVRSTYDPGRPFLPWLMAIAHNRAVDAIRRLARRSVRETAVAEYPETSDEAEANLPGEEYGDPEALRLAVAELPEGQRKAIEMLKFREMSLKEAAGESGMSVGALKVAVHRATKTLRLRLARDGGDGN
jgi:RNA polymerase sigma-70 factor (ECF subfamily)